MELSDQLADNVREYRDRLIKNAITFVLGPGWKDIDIRCRGRFLKYPDGKEIFVFDGKSMIEFHGFDTKIDKGDFTKIEIVIKYKELYL